MGGDGGSIPTRCELVKEKKEPEKKNRDQDMVGKWQHCALSGEALVKPIMSCRLGRLYNKEAVLNHILDKATKSHIKKLNDLVELKLTNNTSYNNEVHADSYIDHYSAPYICPIIALEMSGRYRFIYNWTCGCAISERATIEVPSETCHRCGGPITKEDTIVINGNDDDVKDLAERMKRRRERLKQEKKAKKQDCDSKDADQSSNNNDKSSKSKKHPADDKSVDGKSVDGPNKKVKVSSSASSHSKNKFEDTASYKKLFHKNSDKKDKAHWVTYNPYYN